MSAEITAIVSEPTCSTTDCTYSGTEVYTRDGDPDDKSRCGRYMDRLDDDDMPYIVDEYTWMVLKDVEARS